MEFCGTSDAAEVESKATNRLFRCEFDDVIAGFGVERHFKMGGIFLAEIGMSGVEEDLSVSLVLTTCADFYEELPRGESVDFRGEEVGVVDGGAHFESVGKARQGNVGAPDPSVDRRRGVGEVVYDDRGCVDKFWRGELPGRFVDGIALVGGLGADGNDEGDRRR